MASRNRRYKVGRGSRQFLSLYTDMLRHPNFARLTPKAVKLFFNFGSFYNGSNKGVTAIKALPPFIWSYSVYKKEREQLKPPDLVLDPPKRLTNLSNMTLY